MLGLAALTMFFLLLLIVIEEKKNGLFAWRFTISIIILFFYNLNCFTKYTYMSKQYFFSEASIKYVR